MYLCWYQLWSCLFRKVVNYVETCESYNSYLLFCFRCLFKHVFLLIGANDLFFIYVPNCGACSDHFYATIMHYCLYLSGLESPNIEKFN